MLSKVWIIWKDNLFKNEIIWFNLRTIFPRKEEEENDFDIEKNKVNEMHKIDKIYENKYIQIIIWNVYNFKENIKINLNN